MPITDEMLLPARCCPTIDGEENTRLQSGDTVMFGINPQKGVEGHPRFFRGNRELKPTTYYANGNTSSGPSSLLLLHPHEPDEPTECHTQAMVFAEFIASLLGFTIELAETNKCRIIFRFI